MSYPAALVAHLATGATTRRTPAGRELWSRAAGFRRLLATPSSEDRFDYAARQDLYIAYIPYAVAFGVADKWAAKYRAATNTEPPVPWWYPVPVGQSAGGGPGGTARERKTPGNQSDVSWREH